MQGPCFKLSAGRETPNRPLLTNFPRAEERFRRLAVLAPTDQSARTIGQELSHRGAEETAPMAVVNCLPEPIGRTVCPTLAL